MKLRSLPYGKKHQKKYITQNSDIRKTIFYYKQDLQKINGRKYNNRKTNRQCTQSNNLKCTMYYNGYNIE